MTVDLIIIITLAVISSKLFELLLKKWNLSPIPGYVAAGLLTKLFAESPLVKNELRSLTYVSLLFFMLYIGLKSEPRTSFATNLAISISIIGVLAVYASTVLILLFRNVNLLTTLIVAIVLSNTSTEVVAVALDKKKALEKYYWLVNASFMDDVLVIATLSVATGFALSSGNKLVVTTVNIVKTILYLALTVLLIRVVSKHLPVFYTYISRNYYVFVSTTIVTLLCLSSLAKTAGLPEILGAYIAGLLIAYGKAIHDPILRSRTTLSRFVDEMSVLLDSFFTPIYFSITSYSYDITYPHIGLLLIMMIPLLISKTVALYPIIRIKTKERTNSFALSFLMNSRGMLEIAVLNILFDTGILDKQLYSTILLCSLITTVLCPLLFSKLYRE